MKADFDDDTAAWQLITLDNAAASANLLAGEYCIDSSNSGTEPWSVHINQRGINLKDNHTYVLRFDAYASQPFLVGHYITIDQEPWTGYWGQESNIGTSKQNFEHGFVLDKPDNGSSRLVFFLGDSREAEYRVCLDNIQLFDLGPSTAASGQQESVAASASAGATNQANNNATAGASQLISSDFDAGIEEAWFLWAHESTQASREHRNGEACIKVDISGQQVWQVAQWHENLNFKKGTKYSLVFDAYADKAVNMTTNVSLQQEPWTEYFTQHENLTQAKKTYRYDFVMPQDEPKGRVVFNMGGDINANHAAL